MFRYMFEVVARDQAHGLGVRNVGRTIKCPSKYRSFLVKGSGRRSFGRWLLAPPLLAQNADALVAQGAVLSGPGRDWLRS